MTAGTTSARAVEDFGDALTDEIETAHQTGSKLDDAMQRIKWQTPTHWPGSSAASSGRTRDSCRSPRWRHCSAPSTRCGWDPDSVNGDMRGSAYEYLLREFAETSGKKAHDSVDFLRDLLDLTRDLPAAEKAEDTSGAAGLDLARPDVGTLTPIFEEYKPESVPVIVGKVVADIDAIVKEVRWDGWNNSKEGDKAVRIAIRKVLSVTDCLPPENFSTTPTPTCGRTTSSLLAPVRRGHLQPGLLLHRLAWPSGSRRPGRCCCDVGLI